MPPPPTFTIRADIGILKGSSRVRDEATYWWWPEIDEFWSPGKKWNHCSAFWCVSDSDHRGSRNHDTNAVEADLIA